MKIDLHDVKRDERVHIYLEKANDAMAAIGYTEHGFRHAGIVAGMAQGIPRQLGYPARDVELAGIAGYLHDIGNIISRNIHTETGALLAHELLLSMGMDLAEVAVIMGAIGNHEEETGYPINPIAASVIIADKSDVHFSRVQNPNRMAFDIHDRVNFAVQKSYLRVDPIKKSISLELSINTEFATVMEYFEIFLQRMLMCRKAASVLDCTFKLIVNGSEI